MTPNAIPADPYNLADHLASACREAGLSADALSPTRVRASRPTSGRSMAEIIRIMPDETEGLSFYWSSDERLGAAADIDGAVASIKQRITSPGSSGEGDGDDSQGDR